MPKEMIIKQKPSVNVNLENQSLLFDKEPNSSSFKTKANDNPLFIAD